MKHRRSLCVIPGDGIGPEVTSVAVDVLRDIDDQIEFEFAEAGWQTFCERGDPVPAETLETISNCKAALFGAVSSPSGKVAGYQSAILKIRQALNLYANIRPIRSGWSGQSDRQIDLVIVRENSEGLYSGRESGDEERVVAEKIVTRSASQRIGRMAVRVAKTRNMQQVLIAHKANVLPASEGLFLNTVRSTIAADAPGLEIVDGLVDIVAHNLVATPEGFQVLVTTNMFGDVLSDLSAYWCGGMGRAPSLNLGNQFAVAEPVHGSAPDIAGKGIADPTATILSLSLLARYHWRDEQLAREIESVAMDFIGKRTRATKTL